MTRQKNSIESLAFKATMWVLAAACFLLLLLPTLVVIIVSFKRKHWL